MLSLTPNPEKLRACDNFFPRGDGTFYTRPGATQVLEGKITHAVAWGDWVVLYLDGLVRVWDGTTLHQVFGSSGLDGPGPTWPNGLSCGNVLQATSVQSITDAGARESRLYIADGTRPLWYIKRSPGDGDPFDYYFFGYAIVNTVLDEHGEPYPLNTAYTVANWRNRLWVGDFTHRVYHCENNDPDAWDPLYEIQVQASERDQPFVLLPNGDELLIGQEHSLWRVIGTSQYNWQLSEITRKRGIAGLDGAAQLGGAVYHAAQGGLFILGSDQPFSADLEPLFAVQPPRIVVTADPARRLVYFNIQGAVYVMHVDRQGEFTRLNVLATGLLVGDRFSGWYGEQGLWLFGQRWSRDVDASGALKPITTDYDTWEQIPKSGGSGRALCDRTLLLVSGPSDDSAVYACKSDEGSFTSTFDLSPAADPVDEAPGVTADYWPFVPVRRELPARIPGQRFRHRIQSTVPIEIHSLQPVYR